MTDLAHMPGLIVTEAVRALAGSRPQLTVNVLRTSWDDQTAVLHDGRADVSYIRLPADQSGLQERWLLEWLRGQAAAGLIGTEDGEAFEMGAEAVAAQGGGGLR